MEGIVPSLINLGYQGPALQQTILQDAICEGPRNIIFTEVIAWLSSELQTICELESQVNPASADEDDVNAFLVELSSLLKELDCPYQCLKTGSIMERLAEQEQRMLLFEYLCTEVVAARILYQNEPKAEKNMKIEMAESSTARDLKEMLVSMGFSKPPDNITPEILFTEVEKKIKNSCHPTSPKDVVGELLFTGSLTEKQWFQLQQLQIEMQEEYSTRRDLLLKRLDVTIQSFKWADRLKNDAGKITTIFDVRRSKLLTQPSVHVSDILSAAEDLIFIEKTSCGAVRQNTKSSVNKVVIGSVPDRGGRPDEQKPPPPEVPSWQKNEPSSSRGNFRGSPASSRGGYSQGGNSNRSNESYSSGGRGGHRYNDSNTRQDNAYDGGRGSNDYCQGYANSGATINPSMAPYGTPVYQPQFRYVPTESAPMMNQAQLGFGGYSQSGGNFQQYGMPQQFDAQQYMPRPHRGGRSVFTVNSRGRGPRGGRAGYGDSGGRRGSYNDSQGRGSSRGANDGRRGRGQRDESY